MKACSVYDKLVPHPPPSRVQHLFLINSTGPRNSGAHIATLTNVLLDSLHPHNTNRFNPPSAPPHTSSFLQLSLSLFRLLHLKLPQHAEKASWSGGEGLFLGKLCDDSFMNECVCDMIPFSFLFGKCSLCNLWTFGSQEYVQ